MCALTKKPSLSERELAWQALADRLELSPSPDRERAIRHLFDLDSDSRVGPIYFNKLADDLRVFALDYEQLRKGPTGQVSTVMTVCMMSLPAPSPVSFKVVAKRSPIIERVEARSVGGDIITLPAGDTLAGKVSLYAHHSKNVLSFLTPQLKTLILRTLTERPEDPAIVLSEKHVMITSRAKNDPTPLGAVELFISDVLALYAAITTQIEA